MSKTTWIILGAAAVWGVNTYALTIVPFGKRGSVEAHVGGVAVGAVAGYLAHALLSAARK